MPKVTRTLSLPCSVEEAFDFVAAWENTARWDPATVSSERLSGGPARLGSTYQLVVSVGRRTLPIRYETTVYDRPVRLVLTGDSDVVATNEEFRFATVDDATRITYRGDFRLKGIRRLGALFARPAIERIVDAAVGGLRRALAGTPR